MAVTDRTKPMDADACMALLEANHFGRVAVVDDRGPVILPVNYLLVDGDVIFRSDEGTKLDAAVDAAPATFEIDGADERTRTGWSVVVRGRLEEVTDPGEVDRLARLPLQPFAGGNRERFLRVVAAQVSGLRIDIPEGVPDAWFRPAGLGHVWLDRDAADLGL
jgi:uncharacterized protein